MRQASHLARRYHGGSQREVRIFVRLRLLPAILAIGLAVPAATAVSSAGTPAPAGAVTQASYPTRSPVWTITTSNWDRSSSPTIADLNGDGVPEIIIGHQDGWLRVLNVKGVEMPG